MTVLHPRQDWLPAGEKAFDGSPGFSKLNVSHLTAHYAGVASLDLDGTDNVWQESDTAQIVLGMHRYYWRDRGYGLGYSFVCDQQGHLWTVRGFTVRAASDGSVAANITTVSCLFLTPGVTDDARGDLTAQQIEAARYLAAVTVEWCKGGFPVTKWTGHRDHYTTPCPGDAIYRRVQAGELWPQPPVNPDPVPFPLEDAVFWKVTDHPDYPLAVFQEIAPGLFVHVGESDATRYAARAGTTLEVWAKSQQPYPGGWAALQPKFFPRA